MYLSSIPSRPSSLSRKHLPSLNHQPCRPSPSLKWCFPLSLCPLCLCRKGMGHLDHKAIDLAPNSYRSVCTRHSLHLGKRRRWRNFFKGNVQGDIAEDAGGIWVIWKLQPKKTFTFTRQVVHKFLSVTVGRQFGAWCAAKEGTLLPGKEVFGP